jgi:hypothetical protein
MSTLRTAARMAVEPARTRIDEKVHVRILGLEPSQTVVLRARMGDDWSSYATFQADTTGVVDVSSQPALLGSYQGIDQMGLFWSMVAQDELKAASFLFQTPLTPQRVASRASFTPADLRHASTPSGWARSSATTSTRNG